MSTVSQIKVNEKDYNVVRASAVNQKKLMTLIGGIVTASTASTGSEISVDLLSGTLMMVPETTLVEIEGIVLNQVVLNGTEHVVTIDDFQDEIFSYFRLIAEALKANLQDFFTYLDESNAPRRREVELMRQQREMIK